MKCIILLSVLLMFAAAEKYTTENDDLDIEAVVNHEATLKEFVACFLDTGDCNEQTLDFKGDIKEAVEQACAKCTDAQKHIFKRFLEVLKVKYPKEYELFQNKYDPQNKYFNGLEAAIANA